MADKSQRLCAHCPTPLAHGARFCAQCGGDNATESEGLKIQEGFDATKLKELQDDSSSPLFAMSTWEELNLRPELLDAIRLMNFQRPSRIQCATLPHIIQSDENVIGQSQSGTGKTACFGLGLLSKVDENINSPQALVISPTRELAQQITMEVKRMAKYLNRVKIITCVPGYDFTGGVSAQVVIGTPGRVKDAIERRFMNLRELRILVLDEADEMLSKGTGPSRSTGGMAAMSMSIQKKCPRETQILLFSATYPQEVRKFCMAMAPNAKKFSINDKKSLNLSYIKQAVIMLPGDDRKFEFLMGVYQICDVNQSIIFVNTREAARNLAEKMRAQNYAVALLQSEMPNEKRDQVVDSFRKQSTRVLIATNIIARGMDVPQVSIVINYNMPFARDHSTPDYETYLHRIGRCGRFGRPGIAINLVGSQKDAKCLDDITKYYDIEMQQIESEADVDLLVGGDAMLDEEEDLYDSNDPYAPPAEEVDGVAAEEAAEAEAAEAGEAEAGEAEAGEAEVGEAEVAESREETVAEAATGGANENVEEPAEGAPEGEVADEEG